MQPYASRVFFVSVLAVFSLAFEEVLVLRAVAVFFAVAFLVVLVAFFVSVADAMFSSLVLRQEGQGYA